MNQITQHLSFETKRIFRSRLLTGAVLLYALVFVFAAWRGTALRDTNRQRIDVKRQQADETRQKNAALFDSTSKAPPGRPWMKITEPFWADRMTASIYAREVYASSFVTPGLGEVTPLWFTADARSHDRQNDQPEFVNPEQLQLGVFDLSFVLVVLLPVLLLLLTLDAGSWEAETGLISVIQHQVGSVRSWLAARFTATGILAVGFHAILIAVVVVYAGAFDALFPLTATTLVYALFWLTVFYVTALFSRNRTQQATAGATAWLLAGILLPAAIQQAHSYVNSPSEALVIAQLNRDKLYELGESTNAYKLMQFSALYPDYANAPFIRRPDTLNDAQMRTILVGLIRADIEKTLASLSRREEERHKSLKQASLFAPSMLAARALQRIAGTSFEHLHDFRMGILDIAKQRFQYIAGLELYEKEVSPEDFHKLAELQSAKVLHPSFPTEELLGVACWTVLMLMAGNLFYHSRSYK